MDAVVDKAEILRAVRLERTRTVAFVRKLDPAEWDTPTALPGWRIREVVAHLISLDVSAVNGSILPVAIRSMDRLERWNDRQVAKRADRSPTELVLALERWGPRFVRLARAIPKRLYVLRVPTIWGRAPGGLLIWSRVYDEWVHRQDMRRALGLPHEDADLAPVAGFLMHAAIATMVQPLRERGGRVEVRLAGVPLAPHLFDLAAGTLVVGRGHAHDAAIEAREPAPFVMAAAGRAPSLQELRDRGAVIVEGDEGLAKEFLEHLRIV
jgi:uncharacterized protein (TIGR03083 family)